MKKVVLFVCILCLWLTACAVPSESEAGGVTDTTQTEAGAPSANQPTSNETDTAEAETAEAETDAQTGIPTGDECRFCGRLEGNDRWFIARVMENGMVMPLGTDCFEATSAMDAGISLQYSAVDGEEGRRLVAGEIVRITYNGCIMETYPVQIAATSVTVEDEAEVEIETDEDGDAYLVLPVSGNKVRISDRGKNYVKDIDGYLLKTAEEKIAGQISQYGNNSGFYLETYDGYLWLCVEVIVKLDPPAPDISVDSSDEYWMQGCGIDHEHKFFMERITK